MDNQNFIFRNVRKFDGFGANVNLQILGDKNDKNLLGAMISIGMLAISLALSFSTFLDFVNSTNPGISSSIEYSTPNLTINYTNFFFGISFYQPLKDVRSLDANANDISAIKYINQLNISCTTCEGEYLKSESIMNLCNPDQFNNITLKSMSKTKSNGVNSIFSQYSFCFPSDLKSIIKDNNQVNSTQESSLQLFIPVNDVSIEFTNVKQNLVAQPGVDELSSKISTSSSTKIENTEQTAITTPTPASAPVPVVSNNQPPNSQQQPQQNPQYNPSGPVQIGGATSGGQIAKPSPGGATGSISQPTSGPIQGGAMGSQPQQSSGLAQEGGSTGSPVQQSAGSTPGGAIGAQTQQTSGPMQGNISPSSTQQTGGISPTGVTQQAPTQINSPSPQQASSPTTQSSPTSMTSVTSSLPKRFRNLQTISSTSNDLGSNITNYINTAIGNSVNKTIYDMMRTVFFKYKFPKMMIIHRGIEVTTASTNVVNFIYNLDVVDYLDPLTGNPNVFDVYLQKYKVVVDHGQFFGNSQSIIEFVVVNRIEKNAFDSLENSGAYLSFKLYSDSLQIYVKYVSFTDVLGVFGSFYSIFSLFAGILSGLYNELFLDRKLILSVFKFVQNSPNNSELDSFIEKRKNFEKLDQENSNFFHFNSKKNSNNNSNNENMNIINLKDDKTAKNDKNIEMNGLNKNGLYIDIQSKVNKTNVKNKNDEEVNENLNDKLNLNFKENNNDKISKYTQDEKKEDFELKSIERTFDGIKLKDMDTTVELEIDFRELYEYHEDKKKKKQIKNLGIVDFIVILKLSCCCKKKYKQKKEILEKCKQIIDNYLQINNIIKKFFEFEMLKKLMMTENQRKLMKYQLRYLNFDNYENTIKYLDLLSNEDKIEKSIYDNEEKHYDIDLKMLDGFLKYYNF